MEIIKNKLGNLTIMDPGQNTIAGDKPFGEKRKFYEQSQVSLTRQIAGKEAWLIEQFQEHQKLLVDIALKVFVP